MAESFQKEIPPARINITLDLDSGGTRKKKELPLKLLVIGDFSNGKTKGSISERERVNLYKGNFNQVIADLGPELKYNVPNKIKNDGSEITIRLVVDSLPGFHPEHLAQQIPELRRLLAMRNLLKDLKSNVLDNNEFRRFLEKSMKDRRELKQLQKLVGLENDLPKIY